MWTTENQCDALTALTLSTANHNNSRKVRTALAALEDIEFELAYPQATKAYLKALHQVVEADRKAERKDIQASKHDAFKRAEREARARLATSAAGQSRAAYNVRVGAC